MELKRTLENIIRYVVSVTEPEEVILFGSLADGRANKHSDIDLLIITEALTDKKEMVSRIRSHIYQYALKADVLICHGSLLEHEMATPNSFIKAVYTSGKRVYKKSKNNLE
ncbi:MAG: nucleotidyltransferase domain-containing protein [Daejeonella sp.]